MENNRRDFLKQAGVAGVAVAAAGCGSVGPVAQVAESTMIRAAEQVARGAG